MLKSVIMKRKFKQWCSIPPISTKQTITSYLNWTHWMQKILRHMMLEKHWIGLS